MSNIALRGAIYCRMSKSNGEHKIEAQEAMCRQMAAANGVEVVSVYVDDGVSAYSGRSRPGWGQMLEAVARGDMDVLLAQSEDRFSRQPMEKELLLATCAGAGVFWLTVNDGRVDPASADGAFFSVLRGGLARMESARKSERQRQANDHRAGCGQNRVGGPRPFGWQGDKMRLNGAEAGELRWAIQQVLAGASLFSIVRAWNGKGFKSSTGADWQTVTVRQVLLRPRNAGLVLHRGEVLSGVVGEWEAVCTPEEWRSLVAIMKQKRSPLQSREQKHLLTTLMRCVCGEPMRYGLTGNSVQSYRCHSGVKGTGSGRTHASIREHLADDLVTKAVVSALLMGASVADADGDDLGRLHRALAEAREEAGRLSEVVARGVMTMSDVAAAMAARHEKIEALEGEIARISAANAQAALTWEAGRALWGGTENGRQRVSLIDAAKVRQEIHERFVALPIEQRRSLVRAYVDIRVEPGRDISRVKITHLVAKGLND